MQTPKINEILWLVKNKNGLISVVGFLRDHHDGVFIIEGETGSHYSGHGETWKNKWDKYITENYIPRNLALEKGLISNDWKPPLINKEDQKIINKISIESGVPFTPICPQGEK